MDRLRDQSHNVVMKTIGAAQFKAQCLAILDDADPEGIVITKRGKPVGKLVPIRRDPRELIGVYKDRSIRTDPNDDLLSTGAWTSDEWGDLNEGRRPNEAPGQRRQRRP